MKTDFKAAFSQFGEAKKILEKQAATREWVTRIAYFPDDKNPMGVGIQFSKPNWFNDDGRGIHFETWVTEKEIGSGKLKFVLHVLHQDHFPGTDKKAWDLLWPFLEDQAVIDLVAEWKGFKMGRTHPVKGERKFKDTVADVVVEEFSRFVSIGDRMDLHLKKLLKETGKPVK